MISREASKILFVSASLTAGLRPVRSARLRVRSVSLRSAFTPMVTSTMPKYIISRKGSIMANSTAAMASVARTRPLARLRSQTAAL
jgi:hypothetical protein